MFKLPSNFAFLIFILPFVCQAQNKVVFKVTSNKGQALDAVDVIANYVAVGKTNGLGFAVVPNTIVGQRLHFSSIGYEALDTLFHTVPVDTVIIALKEQDKSMEEVVVVSSTRSNQRIENSPIKVEVLGREDMNEENSIKPAGIASILGDVSGVQIQQSSAVTGNANVRIQGLDGRYTQILKDGMPLYDGFSGGFGILSIPPLDLKQVELIKGSASTLYGGGAIGGLVNIISRKPTLEQDAVVTLNQTTLRETNANTFIAKRFKKFGYTFFGGYTYQKAVDVNADGFSDVPNLNSVVVHPRLFFYPDERTIITTGYTGTFESRSGGDMQVLSGKTDANHQYFETNKIDRSSFELSAERFLNNNRKIEFKNSLSQFNRTIQNPTIDFTGTQLNYYSELSMLMPYGKNSLVAGINATGDRFKKVTQNIPLHNFENNTIGAFAQNTWNVKDHVTIELGIRNDYHFTYGDFFLPRIAVFYKIDKHWASRAGIGFGYKTPNALNPQTTDIAIQHILPLPSSIQAEKSIGYNAEVNYRTTWGGDNSLFINQAFFLTQLNNPIVATIASNGDVTFGNESKPIVSKGFDTYVKSVWHHWELYAGYTYTIAERKYLADNQFLPLTPRNRFAFTVVRDFEKYGIRFGLEGSYNGSQYRVDYTHTPGYFFMAAMIEKKLGKHFSMVLNGENLLDFRQSRVEALYSGTQANPSFVPLWAPIDGRVINLSLKWKL
ncbi:MAG: TonB-dependent receptor [Bacteroidetes bacterium]|nr:TonB-dependent receptor [Bacteroidota bacterium]